MDRQERRRITRETSRDLRKLRRREQRESTPSPEPAAAPQPVRRRGVMGVIRTYRWVLAGFLIPPAALLVGVVIVLVWG